MRLTEQTLTPEVQRTDTFSRENPGELKSREKQEDTGTVGRKGKARERDGNNRHRKERKERTRKFQQQGVGKEAITARSHRF